MDATKASDMRTLQLHRLHQAAAEGNVPEANITHATRCPHTHVFRAQACSQQAGRGGSNSLPGSALTETSRPQWSRATKPKLRGGDKEANGVAVKRGSPQARALGGVQRGHPRAWRACSGSACLSPVLRRVQLTQVLNPFRFQHLIYAFSEFLTESSKSCPLALLRVIVSLTAHVNQWEMRHSRTEDFPLCHQRSAMEGGRLNKPSRVL